ASSASALQEATGTVPVVFMGTSDPVNRRLIASMEKPAGNFTGYVEFEPGIGVKWLELLKQIAPNVTRVAVVQDPMRSTWKHVLTGIEKAAPSFNVQVTPVDARDSAELERFLATFAGPDGGLIVTPNLFSALARERLVALAARHKLPAVYFSRFFVTEGGLISYAPTRSISTTARQATSTASSRAKSLPTCRCRRRPNSRLSPTSERRR